MVPHKFSQLLVPPKWCHASLANCLSLQNGAPCKFSLDLSLQNGVPCKFSLDFGGSCNWLNLLGHHFGGTSNWLNLDGTMVNPK